MGEQDVLKMQQRKDFLIKFCYWAVIAVCVYAVFKYLLQVLFPFVLAYGIACGIASGKIKKPEYPLVVTMNC